MEGCRNNRIIKILNSSDVSIFFPHVSYFAYVVCFTLKAFVKKYYMPKTIFPSLMSTVF